MRPLWPTAAHAFPSRSNYGFCRSAKLLLMSFPYLSLCLNAGGAGGDQNHLIPLEIKLLHLLAEGSEPAHGQSAILPVTTAVPT